MKLVTVLFTRIISLFGGAGLAAGGIVARQQEFRQCRGVSSSLLQSARLVELDDSLMDYVLTCGIRCNKDLLCQRFFICFSSSSVCRLDMINQNEELSDGCYCFDKVHMYILPTTTEGTCTNIIHSQAMEQVSLPSSLNGVSISSVALPINASPYYLEDSRTSPVSFTTVTEEPSHVITEAPESLADSGTADVTSTNSVTEYILSRRITDATSAVFMENGSSNSSTSAEDNDNGMNSPDIDQSDDSLTGDESDGTDSNQLISDESGENADDSSKSDDNKDEAT